MAMNLSPADLPGEKKYSAQLLNPDILTRDDRHHVVHVIDKDLARLDFTVTEKHYANSPPKPSARIRALLFFYKDGTAADTIFSKYERIRHLGAELVKGFQDVTLQICNREDYIPFPHNVAPLGYVRYMGRFYVPSCSAMEKKFGPFKEAATLLEEIQKSLKSLEDATKREMKELGIYITTRWAMEERFGTMKEAVDLVYEINELLDTLRNTEAPEMQELAEYLFAGERMLVDATGRNTEEGGTKNRNQGGTAENPIVVGNETPGDPMQLE